MVDVTASLAVAPGVEVVLTSLDGRTVPPVLFVKESATVYLVQPKEGVKEPKA
jgi:hypothetical protein